MDRFDSYREPPLRVPSEMTAIIADPARFPLLDIVITLEEDKSIITETTLYTTLHPFLV